MKNLTKLMSIGFLIISLVSCGKENSSGGDSSTSTTTTTTVTTTGTNYSDYSSLLSAYESIDLSSGLYEDMVIYHVGSAYGGSSSSASFSFCLSFFTYTSSGCNNASSDDLQSYVDRGEYKLVDSYSSSSVAFSKATDVDSYGFLFDSMEFDRADGYYIEMLNLDGRSLRTVVVSTATVTLEDGSSVNADYVEYFYSNGSVNGYVLSTAFPLLANPLAITKNYFFKGALKISGSRAVKSISVTSHRVVFQAYTNSYTSQIYDRLRVDLVDLK